MNTENIGESAKLITVILGKGRGKPLLEYLYSKGVSRINFSYARGVYGDSDSSLGEQNQKEILRAVVEKSKADEVFEDLYFQTKMDSEPGAFMTMSDLRIASKFELPKNEAD